MRWDLFDNITYYPSEYDLIKELREMFNTHIDNTTIHMTDADIQTAISKDIVFNISNPISLEEQNDTEFLYPFKGYARTIVAYVPLDAELYSDIEIAIQYYDNDELVWKNMTTCIIEEGTTHNYKEINSFELDNTRLRIEILDGNIEEVMCIGILIRVYNTEI